jgi:hypothetical protein
MVVDHYVEADSKYNDINYQIDSLKLISDYMLMNIEAEALGTIDMERWMLMAQRFADYNIIDAAPDAGSSYVPDFWPGI